MTRVTNIRGINVIGTHAGCNHAIMTTDTRTNHLSMIYRAGCHWCPWRWPRLVAGITLVGAIYVVN